ncbi:MAG: serine/threonine-protein kinase, partial [Acidobacteriota bacterium]
GGELFLVMEYVEGRTLSRVEFDRSDIPFLLKIITKCAEALVAAHDIGVIHRDLKPANIMLTTAGDIKILDFGLAERNVTASRNLSREETAEMTAGGKIRGTLAYMAPEVLRGRPADQRSDLYSLGVVFYQILAGEYPFGTGTQANLICNILNGTPAPIVRLNPAVPNELEECVFRLVEKDPGLRYATAKDLLAHLHKIERDLSFTPLHPVPVPQPDPWLRRHRLASVLLLGLVVAIPAVFLVRLMLPPPLPSSPVLGMIPFESTSRDANSLAFAAGLSEMVSRRLDALSLREVLTTIPIALIRQHGTTDPRDTTQYGANLVLTGKLETRNGNVGVVVALVSTKNGRQLRRAELEAPLSRPGDLEDAIVDQSLQFLKIGRGPPGRDAPPTHPNTQAAYEYFLRGLGYLLSDQTSLSIENLQEALQFEPRFPLAKAYQGLALLQDRNTREDLRHERAENACRAARDMDRRLQVADFCLGEVALARGDLEQAIADYEAALQHGPQESAVLDGLWAVCGRLGRMGVLASILETAVARQPRLWMGYDYLAFVRSGQGDVEAAVKTERKAIELAPGRPSGYRNLGYFYDLLGCHDRAAESYQAALGLRRDSRTYTALAVSRFYTGNYAAALEAATEAKVYLEREADPSYTEAGNLGDMYFWSPGGDPATGLAFYREALEQVNQQLAGGPGRTRDLRSKCWYLAMLGEREAAGQCLTEVLAAPHLDADTCYKLALTCEKLGRRDEALGYLRQSLKEGKPAAPICHEPIFRGNRAVEDLLAPYLAKQPTCP